MKLLCCRHCKDWNALSWGWRECHCGRTGGRYNEDGDTATVWGDGLLFGFSNRAWSPLLISAMLGDDYGIPNLKHLTGDQVLWNYDESNGKITRLVERPEPNCKAPDARP